jgi:tetratricopeptide (TPR) repeat protein
MNSPAAAAPDRSRLERLGNYLQVDPDNPTLLRDYAAEAMRAGEHRACAAAVERLRGLGEATRDDSVLLARALRLDGRLAEALEALAQAAQAWPGDPLVAIELAACHFAERSFEQALETLPSLPAAHELAGAGTAMRIRLLHHLGRLDEAAAEAERFAGADVAPHPAVSAAVLAVLVDQSRLVDALRLARSLADAASSEAQLPYEVCEPLAIGALDDDQLEQARGWVRRALSRRTDDGRIWLLKGMTDLRAGASREAIDALERAVDLMPSHPGSHLALGWAWLAAGDLARAQSAFEAGVAASPSFAESHGSLAVLAAMRGERADAASAIRKAQRLDRHCASARWAEQLLAGDLDPAQVSRLAAEVIAHARSQRQPAAPTASRHS